MGELDGREQSQWNNTESLTRVRIWIPSGLDNANTRRVCWWLRRVRKSLARLQRFAVPIRLPAFERTRVTVYKSLPSGLVILLISESRSGRNGSGRRFKKYYDVVSGTIYTKIKGTNSPQGYYHYVIEPGNQQLSYHHLAETGPIMIPVGVLTIVMVT